MFEQATEDIFGSAPEVFRAPALPSGSEFNGIIHLHGSISQRDEMVITVKDFGRAYMTGGQATHFLIELFSNFKILFIGYSYGDTIMNYLTEALTGSEEGRRFALIGRSDDNPGRWHRLGIEPIIYPQSNENDHGALNAGIHDLANRIRWRASDWKHKITEIAENPPPLDEETEDLIKYALTDATRTRFFTETATTPEWIDWLDEREYLNPLFLDSVLSDQDEILSRWLVEQFACDWANKLFLLIGKHKTRLHPRFWSDIAYRIGRDKETSWDKNILSRWVSLLLTTAQRYIDTDNLTHGGMDTLLQWMGERCIQHEMLDGLLQIFNVIMGSRLRLREGYLWPNDHESNESPPVDVELLLIGSDYVLNQLWEEGLKPELPQVAEPLLSQVIKRLENRHITLCAWQKASRNWNPESDRRSAIEPHEQNVFSDAIDVLIDAARGCLESLALNQVDAAAQWCDQLVQSDAPLLRRLAIHGVSKRGDLTADDKINWLLKHVDLHERSIHHEVFRVVGLAYREISSESREVLIESVQNYPWAEGDDPDTRRYIARHHFDWFDWLHQSDPNCALARQALDTVLAEYQNFESREHPDLLHWMSLDWEGVQTSWTPEQLLTNPVSHWLSDLLSFQVAGEEPNRRTLLNHVAEAATQNFDWGLDLANVLGDTERWDTDLWSTLIHAWSRMELDEDQHRKVLYWLGRVELYPKHNREIAEMLYTLIKLGGPSYALDLLPQANEIATALWCHLDQPEPTEETNDWLRLAIDYPAWDLAYFWLSGLSLWLKHQDPRPTVLSGEYRAALLDIVEDRSLTGKLGRTILTSNFAFLLAVDETWTREYLLPLLHPDSDDFQAAWNGFLNRGRLNPAVAEVMADPFLKAVEQINSDFFNQRDRFVKYYIYMFEYLDENPLDRWIPKFFQYASQEQPSEVEESMLFPSNSQETKDYFAAEVGSRLRRMAEADQQEWWQRWLKRYWENRLQGVPAALEAGEIARMLNWLPHLTSVFPEAVDLAVRMPRKSLQNCQVIEELNRNDLWQRQPESVVKLLIYLRACDLPGYSWYSARELIDQLLQLDISQESRQELQEIRIQL